MSYQFINPFVQFVDPINGKPLSGGSVYFGRMDTDPKNQPANRLSVYAVQDNGSEVLLSQPITLNAAGQPQYSGSVKQIKVELYGTETAYAIQVFNSSAAQKGYSSRVYSLVDVAGLADPNSSVSIAGKTASFIAKSISLITPKAWGINCDGSDETAKWQTLIAYCAANKLGIGSFTGTTVISSQLVFPAGFGGIWGDSQLNMVFIKGFNGDMFSLNAQGMVLQNFWIQGNGSLFTGGGVRVVSDNIIIEHVRITDTADSTIICNANAAKFLDVEDCHLYALDSVNTAAIRGDGVDISTSPTVRKFDKISGSFYLLDSSGMNEYTLCNSLFSKLNFDANCSKGKFYGNRITAASNNITVLGDSNVFFGNIIAMGASNDFTISGNNTLFDVSNVYVKGTNTKASPVINVAYGSPITHSVATKLVDVSNDLVMKGTTSDWVKGNSTVTAYYRLADQSCYYTFTVIRGSTATNAVGTLSITLPYKALVGSQGVVLIKFSTGTYFTGMLQVLGGGNTATLWINNSTAALTDATLTFGTGGILQGTIEYLVSAS